MPENLRKQTKAARVLLGWDQRTLASKANVAPATLGDFETGKRTPTPNNLQAIRTALEEGGVELLDEIEGVCGAGVRLKWREKAGQERSDDEGADAPSSDEDQKMAAGWEALSEIGRSAMMACEFSGRCAL